MPAPHVFVDESKAHGLLVAAAIAGLPVTVDVYDATSWPNRQELQARQHCLERLVANLAGTGCARLVLELDDSLAVHDNRVLYAAGRAHGLDPTWRYEHLRAKEEPLLWLADIVAWCWPKGGSWKQAVNPIVGTVHQL